MSQAIFFSAACPQCKREQLQGGFTVADLVRLLYGGDPIEAYCSFCDELWAVNVQKRVELGKVVTAAWAGNAAAQSGHSTDITAHRM